MDAEQITQTKKEPEPMTPNELLRQLYYGYHLEPDELKRVKELLRSLTQELKSRTRKESK